MSFFFWHTLYITNNEGTHRAQCLMFDINRCKIIRLIDKNPTVFRVIIEVTEKLAIVYSLDRQTYDCILIRIRGYLALNIKIKINYW